MEDHVHEDEIDDIACAIELSLLDLNHKDEEFVATDEASSSNNYLDENRDEEEDEDIIRAIEESLKPSNLSYGRGPTENCVVCDVCDKLVIRTETKRIEFWNQNICNSHWSDNTPKCGGCYRFKTNEVEYIKFSDGRNICPNCYSTAILDDQKCQPLVQKCYQFFERLGMKVRKDIPFYLVDQLEMSSLVAGDTSSNPIHPTTNVRGLTMINSPPVERKKSVGKRMKVEHSKHKGLGCGIQIAILCGLPKIVTGAILAHEMMHAWLQLQEVVNLEAKVEEGICQVMGYQWLDWSKSESAGRRGGGGGGEEEAEFMKNLLKYFKYALAMDSSEAYGEGFRYAQCAVAKYGLKHTITHIITHGTLPDTLPN